MVSKLLNLDSNHGVWAAVGVAIVAAIVMLFPVPQDEMTLRTLIKIATSAHNSIVIVGNSAIDHSSVCDIDTRSISQMVAEDSGMATTDLSYAGQELGQMINFAAAALRSSSARTVVVPVSLFQFGSRPIGDVRSQMFFRLLAGPFSSNDVTDRLSERTGLEAGLSQESTAFSYKGRQYPDIEGIKLNYFLSEQRAAGCPEALGRDRQFSEAYHWNNYLRMALRSIYVTDLVALQRTARARHKALRIVLLPVNYEDMRTLDPSLAHAVMDRARRLVTDLNEHGVPVIDLSSGSPATFFADRWCACGHLQEDGRKRVAARIAQSLN